MVTKSDKIFSGYQLIHSTVKMRTEIVPETSAIFNQLIWLIFREDFISVSETVSVSEKLCLKKKTMDNVQSNSHVCCYTTMSESVRLISLVTTECVLVWCRMGHDVGQTIQSRALTNTMFRNVMLLSPMFSEFMEEHTDPAEI
jgi:hypothetical protein